MITVPDEVERSIIEAGNRIAKLQHPDSDHHELRHELLTTLNELGDRHGFHTSGTPGCTDLRRLYDVVWMKNELGELLDVPLVAALEFSPEFQLVEEGFYKLVVARSQHRVMIFKGINEQAIEKHVERFAAMIRSFAATRKEDRYLFLGFCDLDKDVKAEVWTAE